MSIYRGSTWLCTRTHLVHLAYCRFSLRHWTTRPVTAHCTPTTLKHIAPVRHPMSVIFLYKISVGALTLLVTGCRAIGFNLMVTRLSSCGSLQPDANSDSPLLVCRLARFAPLKLRPYGAIRMFIIIIIFITAITPCKAARDIGVYIDVDLTMRTHVQWTVSYCVATLRQLRTIRRSVPLHVFRYRRISGVSRVKILTPRHSIPCPRFSL